MTNEIKGHDVSLVDELKAEAYSTRLVQPEPSGGAEKQEDGDTGQPEQPPMIEVIAIVYDVNGREPRRVVDFDHASGRRVRRLLPEDAFTSPNRLRTALIRAGVLHGTTYTVSRLVDVAMMRPTMTGMYGVPFGWSHGCDVGLIYRFGDTVYSSSGPIPIYAEGSVPLGKPTNNIGNLTEILKADESPCSVILVAAHLAALLVPLLKYDPLVLVASGARAADTAQISSLADSAFGTKTAAWHARVDEIDDPLLQLSTVKSRGLAFQQISRLREGKVARGRCGYKYESALAPVTLVVTTEADTPANLASPRPPVGCVEIPFDAWGASVPEETSQASRATNEHNGAAVAQAYIEAVLRDPRLVIRYAETMLPKFVDHYRGIMKGGLNEEAVHTAVTSFALLRFALTCGYQLKVVPWSGDVINKIMDTCVTRWAERHRERETAFERYTLDAVKKLADSGISNQRTKSIDREVIVETVKGRELLLMKPNSFNAHVVASLDKAHVLEVLRKYRLLVTNVEGAQYQKRIDGRRARFYTVDAVTLRTVWARMRAG